MIEARGVEAADLLDFRFPSRPAFAPDGAAVAFVVAKADANRNRYCSNIWLLRTATRECRQLTTGNTDDEPLWLAFRRDRCHVFRAEDPGAALAAEAAGAPVRVERLAQAAE